MAAEAGKVFAAEANSEADMVFAVVAADKADSRLGVLVDSG